MTLKIPIENFVFSGGGQTVAINYAIMHSLFDNNFWNYSSIKSLWGSSAGALTCVFIGLKLNIQTQLKPYIICKKWNKLINKNIYECIFNICNHNGIFDKSLFIKILKPLFRLQNLNIETLTMKEFYEFNNYDIFIMTYDFATSKEIIISHKSYPDFLLLDAVYCSCSLPLLFQPYYWNNTILLDAFLSLNITYPVEFCKKYLQNNINNNINNDNNVCELTNANNDEIENNIFGIINSNKKFPVKKHFKSFFGYLFCLIFNFLANTFPQHKTKYELCINEFVSPIKLLQTALLKEKREKYYELGYSLGNKFCLDYQNSQIEN